MVSEIVHFECLAGALKRNDPVILARYDEFFQAVPKVELASGLFRLAAELRANANLRAIDALHVASAVTGHCDQFWTNDARLANAPLPLNFRRMS